jgi:hypothetical protein
MTMIAINNNLISSDNASQTRTISASSMRGLGFANGSFRSLSVRTVGIVGVDLSDRGTAIVSSGGSA